MNFLTTFQLTCGYYNLSPLQLAQLSSTDRPVEGRGEGCDQNHAVFSPLTEFTYTKSGCLKISTPCIRLHVKYMKFLSSFQKSAYGPVLMFAYMIVYTVGALGQIIQKIVFFRQFRRFSLRSCQFLLPIQNTRNVRENVGETTRA